MCIFFGMYLVMVIFRKMGVGKLCMRWIVIYYSLECVVFINKEWYIGVKMEVIW